MSHADISMKPRMKGLKNTKPVSEKEIEADSDESHRFLF